MKGQISRGKSMKSRGHGKSSMKRRSSMGTKPDCGSGHSSNTGLSRTGSEHADPLGSQISLLML